MDAKILTFLDDEEIEIGEDLKPELESAIKASRAFVIVLSKNYTTSTWCLDELVLILEQRMMEAETNENKVSKWTQKIDRWNKALIKVADLKGMDANGRLETEFIEETVKDIYRRLHVNLRIPLPLLIGMDYSITLVTSWLKDASSHSADILTISGMGGVGKTALAQYVYGLHCSEFKTSSYIGNISRRHDEKFSGMLDLQKQLFDDISKTSSIQVHDVSVYTSKIENAVARKKVFLVLDDIDTLDQLDALLGSKGFHPGRKIIITTKDAWLIERCALFKTNIEPKHAKHELQGLQETRSLQLLCFHAFMSNHSKEGYEEVSEKFVKYCEGHPLALEVLGKSLHNRDVAYWEKCIEGLKKEIGSHIDNVLMMSFDSLPSQNDKDLFMHISCFFIGIDRYIAETILKACDINTRSGIMNLIDRCLFSIGWNNELVMHQFLQKMGRFIVHQESPQKPWKRTRLWCHKESFEVLKRKKGKGNLLGLAFDMRMLENGKLHSSFELEIDALSKMDNLMLLQLNYVHINGSYENFPKELRWLCMHGFPLKSIPSNLSMENLVALDMSYSNIESFGICYRQKESTGSCLEDIRLPKSLKILNLSFCEQLGSLGGFDQILALERLILRNCTGLLEICESVEQCVELVLIDLSYCKKFENFPRSLGMLKKVKTLLLEGCNLGKSQFEIRDMDSEMFMANNIIINTKTSSPTIREAIPSDTKFFAISLPKSLVILSLANNNLSTESFPMDFSCVSMLEELYLDGNPIISMPNCVRSLPRLGTLSMQDCKMLTSVERPPNTVTYLDLLSNKNHLIRKLAFDPEMSPLKLLMEWTMLAPSSFEFEGMVKIQPIAGVEGMILRSLGWNKLDFLDGRRLETDFRLRGTEESEIQMSYEFGIFSTIYGGQEMPNWITDRSTEPSISFTIPSSPNNLIGFEFLMRGLKMKMMVMSSNLYQRS